jgi:hypothetical protein
MLPTLAVEIEPRSLVARNGTHHFRLQSVVEPGFETEVQVTYHPACGSERCTPPTNTTRWILLCLDTSWNKLFDLEISVGNTWRYSSPVRLASCGECIPNGPALRVFLPRASPTYSPFNSLEKSIRASSTPLLSSPQAFAAGVAVGISALFLLVLFFIKLIGPKIERGR